MTGIVPSAILLGALAGIAAWLAITHGYSSEAHIRLRVSHALLLATLVQTVHFTEEAMTGFHHAFPALAGLPPIPFPLFVAFNVGWLIVWGVSIWGVRRGRRLAIFAAWFLALAGILNMVGHPLMALISGAYFPGLFTSPVLGVVSLLLATRLVGAHTPV